MLKPDIKEQLHNYIDMIEDEAQLEMLHDAAEVYAARKQPDVIDYLPPEQLKRLAQSIQQSDEGKLTPHEDVIKLSKQWLTK